MSYPPSPPGSDPNRAQDVPPRPQDTPQNFPTYGRPAPLAPPYQQQPNPYQQPPQQNPYQPQPPPQNPYQQPPQQQNPYQQQAPGYGQPPAQYGYGYGYPGNAGSKVNGLATAALVTGLVGILFALAAPVAVGLGIAALVQIKRRNEGGTGQAVAGLVIGAVVTLLGGAMLALIVTAAMSDDDYQSGSSPTYSTGTTYVDELAVGECFDDGIEDDEVLRRSCADPHDGEITADVMMAAGPYPGDRQAGKTAQARCDLEFATYIGRSADDSELESSFWHPTEESWDEGDRLVVCAAYGSGGDQLTGTVKDSKR